MLMLTNAEGRPAGMPRQMLTFLYDYLGRRVEKKVYNSVDESADPNPTTPDLDLKFVYDGFNLVAELDANAADGVLRTYVWGLDLSGTLQGAGGTGGLLMVGEGTKTWFTAYDGNGNLTGLIDVADGSLAAAYEYGPFGEPLRVSGSGIAHDNPFRFSSKYADEETGLIYYGFRYYSPSPGRFLNRDPLGEAGGSNLYAFMRNDPVNRVDFLGLMTEADGSSTGGGSGNSPTNGCADNPFDVRCNGEDLFVGGFPRDIGDIYRQAFDDIVARTGFQGIFTGSIADFRKLENRDQTPPGNSNVGQVRQPEEKRFTFEEILEKFSQRGVVAVLSTGVGTEGLEKGQPNIHNMLDEQKRQDLIYGKGNTIVVNDVKQILDGLKNNSSALLIIDAHVSSPSGNIVIGLGEKPLSKLKLHKIAKGLPNLEAVCVVGCNLADFPQTNRIPRKMGAIVFAADENVAISKDAKIEDSKVIGTETGREDVFLIFNP